MPKPETNLAAEFHALSCLHRRGIEAYLTLANKKACDIVAVRENRTSVSVEVKAVARPCDWRAGNLETLNPASHFVVLICFNGKIEDTTNSLSVWVFPYSAVEPLMRSYKGTKNVSRAAVLSTGEIYKDAWHLVSGVD